MLVTVVTRFIVATEPTRMKCCRHIPFCDCEAIALSVSIAEMNARLAAELAALEAEPKKPKPHAAPPRVRRSRIRTKHPPGRGR